MLYNLCVTGPNVLGGAQRVAANANTLQELMLALQRDVVFYPSDASKVVAICAFDDEFNEYVLLQSLDGMPAKAKIAVQVDTSDNRVATRESATAYASGLLAAAPGRVPLSGDRVAAAVTEAVRSANGGSWETNPAFNELRSVVAAVNSGTFSVAASTNRPVSTASSAAPPAAAAVPSSRASITPQQVQQQLVLASPSSVASPTIGGSAAGPRKSAAPSRARKSAAPGSSADTAAPAPPVSDTITVYCVYSGNNSQRAKAVTVDRHQPYLEGILSVLRQKFKTDVVLGYIYEDGTCFEVTTDQELGQVLRLHQSVDSVTLHCWATPGAHLDVSTGYLVNASMNNANDNGYGGQSPASEGGRSSARKSVRSAKSAKSAANRSVRSTKSGKLDVSGAPLTDEELRELFEELDVDGTGCLDREEFKRYYVANYDSMGIDDYDRKFDQFLASTGAFGDGKITFDEFAVVMLKLAQL